MKNSILVSVFTLLFWVASAQEARTVFGVVTDGRAPMSNVTISVLDKDNSTFSDADGKYKIQVETGDKLQFTYAGMKTITIRVEDVTRILNPEMVPDITELEEVVVESSKRRSQQDLGEDYAQNTNIIRTAFGYLNAETSPGRIRTLSRDDINLAAVCILDVLRTRFPGVTVTGDCQTGGSVNIRGGNSISLRSVAIFDVDGQIFEQAPIWLDISNIKRLALFNNFALTTKYGGIANGGVVVINTVNGTLTNNEIVDQARLRNNFYDGKALSQEQVRKNWPTYLKQLYASNSFDEAKQVYETHKGAYSSSPYFQLDAHNYFVNKWNENDFANNIIKEHYDLFENNAVLLKALAYSLDEQNRFKESNEIFREIFILRPNYSQSYLDMANSYRDLNEPKQAAAIYARYDYLLQQGFLQPDSTSFDPVMSREFNNLLSLEKNTLVKGKKANQLYVAEEDFKGTRLVFEWNDSEAEFDLQFVNPENQYLKWQHTLADNEATILREKEFGYNVKEYLIDGSLPGTWQVNINYFGNKSLTPTYLKATVYSNYGTKAQRKDVKVFKVDLKNVNQELFRVNVAGGLTQE